jgi:hypothetical protein
MFEGFFHYLSSEWTVKNSIIWGNGNDIDMSFGNWENVSFSDLQNAEGMPVFSFLGQISSDPIFSDPANNDFSLTPCSPCLGTGENGYDMGIEINSGVPSCAEYCPLDSDGDGYTVCGADFIRGTGTDEDCDDNDPNVYPGASLICDGKDNNCDGYKDFSRMKTRTEMEWSGVPETVMTMILTDLRILRRGHIWMPLAATV